MISLNYCRVDACSPWSKSNASKWNALWVDSLEQGAMKLGRQMVKVTLGVDSERQIIKAWNACKKGDTSAESCSFHLVRGSLGVSQWRGHTIPIQHVWNRRVGQAPAVWLGMGSVQVWGQPANEDLRHLAKQPQSLAISEPMQTAPPTFTKGHSHICVRAAARTQRLCLFWWQTFLPLGLCEVRQTHRPAYASWVSAHVLAKWCLQQLAGFNGAVMGVLRGKSQPLRNHMILISRQ